MRIVAMIALFTGLLYTFMPRPEPVVHIDEIKSKVSAIKRTPKPIVEESVQEMEIVESDQEPETADSRDTASEDESAQTREPEGNLNVPWNELEQGWFAELKDQLIRLDPEEGEAIYGSYMNEKEKYQTEVDAIYKERSNLTEKDAALEFDAIMSEIDRKHEERLKEILGRHFEEVSTRQQEYLESMQYLSHGSDETEIATPL
jgi:hypothetical protein